MSIVLDRPPTYDEAVPVDDPPPTQPQRRRQWWRWRFPWVKTAVGAPLGDEPLLVVNSTGESWALALGYHDLGVLPPHDQYAFEVSKAGLLSARQPNAPSGTPYLTLTLAPRISAVEIYGDTLAEATLYGLRIFTGRRARPRSVKELLSRRT